MGGMVLLLVGAAVARTIEMDEPLWQRTSDVCSPALRAQLFGAGNYPVGEARAALASVAKTIGLREQLDLPGKHCYWRTVQLQVGFSGKNALARLPYWLAGQGLPEVVKTLLSESDENSSEAFRSMWKALRLWIRNPQSREIEKTLVLNPWYPTASHAQLKQSLAVARQTGIGIVVDEEAGESSATMLAGARLKNGEFEFGLSGYIPSEVTSAAARVLHVHVEGKRGVYKLSRNADEERVLEDGPIRISVRDALELPVREVRVFGLSGTVYRERLELWPLDQDFTIYDGAAGRMVHDLDRFRGITGHAYALITAADVFVKDSSREIDYADRSQNWCFYRFPTGFPEGLALWAEGAPLWEPLLAKKSEAGLPGAYCQAREISPLRLSVSVFPPSGWAVESFRFCGQLVRGNKGEVAVSPIRRYEGRSAKVRFSNGSSQISADLKVERAAEEVPGAAIEDGHQGWNLLPRNKALDAGTIEGNTLAIRWCETDADDPWLTLGEMPVVANPRSLRRQGYAACGEPLELRFGLMNEVRNYRLTFAPAVYATGLLAEVKADESRTVLVLRVPIEAANELQVWVWETGQSSPRLLDSQFVSPQPDHRKLFIAPGQVGVPLGWAISLDGEWRGARFAAEPQSRDWDGFVQRWLEALRKAESWQQCAAALRWWRFPVLMEPFRETVEAQAARFGLATLKAWISPQSPIGGLVSRSSAEFYMNPLRTLLWNYRPRSCEAMELWKSFADEVIAAFDKGQVSPTCSLLLYAHPVLLARLIAEALWTMQQASEAEVPVIPLHNLLQRGPDPGRIHRIEMEFQALFAAACDLIERHASIGQYGELARPAVLRAEALSDLKSWTDSRSLDGNFFEEHIVRPAEDLFDGVSVNTDRLRIAVGRSRACAAYIASHLLRTRGFRANP